MPTLPAFTLDESRRAKLLLATQVASMMGRKLEEGDWTGVYCKAKNIPDAGWSNLHIDVNYRGLGVEIKLLRVRDLKGKPLKSVCGTTLMHPSATRSIRIEDTTRPAQAVMEDVFAQYADVIERRAERVRAAAAGAPADMRIGWLVWESSLTEFLYFEEPMLPPDPAAYTAEWNSTPARGTRKASKSLWIFEKAPPQRRRYSVTTSAGVKIQPYFDVPVPSDENLYYFRVQSEPVDDDTVVLWVAASTAQALKGRLGSLDRETVSAAVAEVLASGVAPLVAADPEDGLAVPVPISAVVHDQLVGAWDAVSDEHRAQLLLRALA